MRRVVAIILLMSLILNCSIRVMPKYREREEKPIFLHEYVGDNIDSIERQTYALFPSIDGFVEAVLYEHPWGGYEWEIFTEDGRFVAYNEDSLAVAILADYIERHDEIVESNADFERAWDIVDYDVLGQPITQKEVDSVIEQLKKRRGRRMAGCLVSGCLSGALLGCLVGYGVREGPEYPDPEGAFLDLADIPKEAIGIGAVAGALAGLGVGAMAIRSDAQQAIKIIKEGRKPRVVE